MAEVLFKKVDYSLKKLIEDIFIGEIGLPDIQRPFVWPMTKVRDLFDSMYRGFPIGYLLFWENGYSDVHLTIGTGQKQKVARLLIVDGQQRLASLYAVMKSVPIVTRDYKIHRVKIAFHPLSERFEVSNPAIEKDAEWIADISKLWQPDIDTFNFINEFLKRLRIRRSLNPQEEKKIPNIINRLIKLDDYPLTALEISSMVNEEQVSDIFVRINSQGTQLNQANFILTLMSVFWDDGRKELEEFCKRSKNPSSDNKPSPFNYYLRPNPDQLLRVSVALGFRRARLEHVYSLLRGKDLETRQFSEEQRDKQFLLLREAQSFTLNLQNWHDFFKVLKRVGYPSDQLISSRIAVLYTYALWLIGKRDFEVEVHCLREVIARWFFMATLTGRYTGSPETRFEQDMALLRNVDTAERFVQTLDRQIDAVLTNDYWEVTLPNELETAAARNTGQFAYYAALCLLGAPVLYSKMKVSELLDPSSKAKKSALERHHLFPRHYLNHIGVREKRLINQVANYALVEWSDNIKISSREPSEYVPKLENRFTAWEIEEMYRWHALPHEWYKLDYKNFISERKKLMAGVIKSGFNKLKNKETLMSDLNI